jgi:hypothetical protein
VLGLGQSGDRVGTSLVGELEVTLADRTQLDLDLLLGWSDLLIEGGHGLLKVSAEQFGLEFSRGFEIYFY